MRHALSVLALGLALAGAAVPRAAEACSCMPPDLTRSYFQYSDTFAVKILGERVEGEYRYYRARVLKAFRGCTERGDLVTLETHTSSATCGISLAEGERYLITANGDDTRDDPETYSVGLCGYNVELASLTQSDRDFLLDREVVCDDSTTCGSRPVPRLADAAYEPVCGTE